MLSSATSSTVIGIALLVGSALMLLGSAAIVYVGIVPAQDVSVLVMGAIGMAGSGLTAIGIQQHAAPPAPVTAADRAPSEG